MKSADIAAVLGYSDRYIRTLTKQAIASGKSYIVIKGERFTFEAVNGRGGARGKVYRYRRIEAPAPKRSRRRGTSRVDMAALEALGVGDIGAIDTDGKLRIVRYVSAHSEYSVRAIAWGLCMLDGKDIEYAESLERRIRRWCVAYKHGGKAALEDKRGGKRKSRVDHDLFLQSLVKRGHLRTYYLRYAALWAQKAGAELDLSDIRANVSYEAFSRYFHKHKNDTEVKAILQGMDAIEEALPVFSMAAQLGYPNQQWQIDATSLDIMVKVPVIDGEPDYFATVESDEYILTRYTLDGIVDAYSGARVYKLMKSGTSYGNVRLLEKAIKTLGVPEVIKGDNGKDYASKHFQGVLEELGIVYVAATPYKGSEKGTVERGFRTLQHHALFESLPGYIGHSVEERQKIEAQAAPKSQRGGKGVQSNLKERFMWWWEAERVLDGLIEHIFGEKMREHRKVARHSRTIAHLHERLGQSGERKLSREGVYWKGAIYTSAALWERARVGDIVRVYEEIDDASVVYAMLDDGSMVTLSSDRGAISLEEAIEAKRAYKKREIKRIKAIVKDGKSAAAITGDLVIEHAKQLSALASPKVTKISPKPNPKKEKGVEMLAQVMKAAGY